MAHRTFCTIRFPCSLFWQDFHWDFVYGVSPGFPSIPLNTMVWITVLAVCVIKSVQVGVEVETIGKPPSSGNIINCSTYLQSGENVSIRGSRGKLWGTICMFKKFLPKIRKLLGHNEPSAIRVHEKFQRYNTIQICNSLNKGYFTIFQEWLIFGLSPWRYLLWR